MIKVAIIGIGNRGRTYGEYLYKNKNVQIVALCEKKADFLETYAKKWKVPADKCFVSDEEFFNSGKLADALVITTQDRDHYGHAISALNCGYHLLLEKPVSPIYEQSVEIAELAKERNLYVVVCHVMRYGPYYNKIKEVIDSGVIGEVVHINHTENVGYWHFSHSYVRGNWRREDETSPSILAKCCHDIDLLYWFTGKHYLTVESNGKLEYFTAKNKPEGAPKYCLDGCPAAKRCPYEARKIYYGFTKYTIPYMFINAKLVTENPHPTIKMLKEKLRTSPYGRCVFQCDNDVMEQQVLSLTMENKITATLNMVAFSKRCYRNMHIYGTKGEIYGNDIDGYFTVNVFAYKCRNIRVGRKVISTHGSCDGRLIEEFVKLLCGQTPSPNLTFMSETLESHKVAYYAELARKTGEKQIIK